MKIKELSWKILTFNIKGRQFKMTDFFIEKVTFHYCNIPCYEGKQKRSEKNVCFFFLTVANKGCIDFATAGITSAHDH